ncbi:hypothetical protein LRR81_05995 [Metabacillus sp. GX 13764]|uniref:MotE family protein n=1 Tax=Metabacillus kandeliae TaxID=2900151 RepID=UPI001E57E526|nr:hypothetical protein [Metabacillus kandeliae]MCD7033779.1 hypothetical protein [Metabacillus kandeliae]
MDTGKKDTSKLQWFLFVIVIPVFFTGVLAAIILSIAGVDVIKPVQQAAGSVPGLSFLAEKKEAATASGPAGNAPSADKSKSESDNQITTINMQKQDIKALENDVSLKQAKIEQLSQELRSLKQQIDDTVQNDKQTQTKDLAAIYKKMSASKAAEIIPVLGDQEAKSILLALSEDEIASILEKLSAQDAAKFTKMLADEN